MGQQDQGRCFTLFLQWEGLTEEKVYQETSGIDPDVKKKPIEQKLEKQSL